MPPPSLIFIPKAGCASSSHPSTAGEFTVSDLSKEDSQRCIAEISQLSESQSKKILGEVLTSLRKDKSQGFLRLVKLTSSETTPSFAFEYTNSHDLHQNPEKYRKKNNALELLASRILLRKTNEAEKPPESLVEYFKKHAADHPYYNFTCKPTWKSDTLLREIFMTYSFRDDKGYSYLRQIEVMDQENVQWILEGVNDLVTRHFRDKDKPADIAERTLILCEHPYNSHLICFEMPSNHIKYTVHGDAIFAYHLLSRLQKKSVIKYPILEKYINLFRLFFVHKYNNGKEYHSSEDIPATFHEFNVQLKKIQCKIFKLSHDINSFNSSSHKQKDLESAEKLIKQVESVELEAQKIHTLFESLNTSVSENNALTLAFIDSFQIAREEAKQLIPEMQVLVNQAHSLLQQSHLDYQTQCITVIQQQIDIINCSLPILQKVALQESIEGTTSLKQATPINDLLKQLLQLQKETKDITVEELQRKVLEAQIEVAKIQTTVVDYQNKVANNSEAQRATQEEKEKNLQLALQQSQHEVKTLTHRVEQAEHALAEQKNIARDTIARASAAEATTSTRNARLEQDLVTAQNRIDILNQQIGRLGPANQRFAEYLPETEPTGGPDDTHHRISQLPDQTIPLSLTQRILNSIRGFFRSLKGYFFHSGAQPVRRIAQTPSQENLTIPLPASGISSNSHSLSHHPSYPPPPYCGSAGT